MVSVKNRRPAALCVDERKVNRDMKEYPKIQSLFKRDTKGKMLFDQYSLPEFEYLKDCMWRFTEKVNGTNIRIMWRPSGEGCSSPDGLGPSTSLGRTIGGKTDNAQIPTFLFEQLIHMFPEEKLKEVFGEVPVCLYGEGYGARIQKGGGNYIHDGVSFVLFDVLIDGWWLKQEDVADIAQKLSILTVPHIATGNLSEMVTMVSRGFDSTWGAFEAEGIVARPGVGLMSRNGHRIITKLKHADFKHVIEKT